MTQQKRQILILTILLAIASLGLLATSIFKQTSGVVKSQEASLVNISINEISRVTINNQSDSYIVEREGEGFYIADLPMDLVNPDYLLMLLQESSKLDYIEVVEENPNDLSIYGLDTPEAIVVIEYLNGETIKLLIGATEGVSQNRYVMQEGEDEVLLKKNNQTIRFTMPLVNYLSFEIVPFSQTSSPLYAVGDISFSGSALVEPIAIEAVTKDNEQTLRDAASFGAATHIIRTPMLHEVDQKEAMEIFSSVVGLLNERVLAYNCTDTELFEYGFDNPYLQIEFDFILTKEAMPERIILKVVPYEDGYAVIRDDQRVVHLISDEAFLKVDYAKLVLRWFFSPLITDIARVEVNIDGADNIFEIAGQTNKELSVTLNGKALDMQRFREYYTLLISASNDGEGLIDELPNDEQALLVTIKYEYKDSQKEPDILRLYDAEGRKLYANVNGVTEFKMQEQYIKDLKAATANLQN